MSVPNRVQPGAKVDAELWADFRQSVEENKGAVRGHLRSELETALRLYIGDDADVNAIHVNQRLARIESAMGIAEADGGTPTVSSGDHTHTRADTTPETLAEKPPANTSTDKKVRYLAGELERDLGADFQQVPRAKLRDVVKTEYGFRRDTAKRYVSELVAFFDLVDHPTADGVLVTESHRAELVKQRRAELSTDTDSNTDTDQ